MTARSLIHVACGAALGVILVISCGHNPSTADAADVCTCPPAEPPLTGRIVRVQNQATIPAQSAQGPGAACPDGATVLGGSCKLDTLANDLILNESGVVGPGWACTWKNPTNTPVNVTVTAICLNPAS